MLATVVAFSCLSACNGACLESHLAGQATSGSKIAVDVQNWLSHSLTSHLASIVLRDSLGYNVTTVQGFSSRTAISRVGDAIGTTAGKADVNFELWVNNKIKSFDEAILAKVRFPKNTQIRGVVEHLHRPSLTLDLSAPLGRAGSLFQGIFVTQ